LPDDADRSLLERTAFAAAECANRMLRTNVRDALGIDDGPELLTRQAIARNPRNAVELDIPADAGRDLLSVIAVTAKDLARRYEEEAKLSLWEDDPAEFLAFSAEARQRQQDAEARLGALTAGLEETQGQELAPPRKAGETVLETDTDKAALIDMLGDDAFRAINEPVPRGADAQMLDQLSDDLDVALDRLDALMRSSGAPGISPQYLALQFGKAGARQEEVEAHLAEMDGPAPEFPAAMTGPDCETAVREEKIEAPPAGRTGIETELQIVGEAARDWAADGIAYVKVCGEAYQRHFDERRFWQWPTYPESLSLPAPRNEAERAGLESYLGAFEADLGYRPQIHFEARQAPEAAGGVTGPDEPTVRTGARERAAPTPIEASHLGRNFFGVVAELGAGVARGAGMVFGRMAGMFDAAPAMSAQESDERARSRGQGAAFDDSKRAVVAGRPDAEGVVPAQAGEPEKDVYLAMVMAPPAAAEADRSVRTEQEPEAEQRRGPRL
jgi:hypothetical protein